MAEVCVHDILIPVYNGEDHIKLTVDNILSQSIKDIRLIISDNASKDKTLSLLEAYMGDPRVSVICQNKNIGMFNNWNFLLSQVRAPTFTLISHDDLFAHNKVLENAINILEKKVDCPAVFSNVEYIDGNGKVLGESVFLRKGCFSSHEWLIRSILSCRNKFGLPIAIRKEAAIGVKFDESLKYAADLDFAISVSKSIGRPYHLSEAMFLYRVHGNNSTIQAQRHALNDMKIIAGKNNIKLCFAQKIIQVFACFFACFFRTLFLLYMKK